MNPASRHLGNPQQQAVFEALVDDYYAKFLHKSREELGTELANAIEDVRLYDGRRQGKVGTRDTVVVDGSGRYTVQMPAHSGSDRKRQRALVNEYNRNHHDERIPILARQDAAELLLKERAAGE